METAGNRPGLKWQIQYTDPLDMSLNVVFTTSTCLIPVRLLSRHCDQRASMSSVILARVAMKTGVLIFAHLRVASRPELTAGRERWLDVRNDVLMPIMRAAWNKLLKKAAMVSILTMLMAIVTVRALPSATVISWF